MLNLQRRQTPMRDIIIVGGGPAGVSAALTAKNRGKDVLILTNPAEENNLWKAKVIDNYPGMPSVSGAELLGTYPAQVKAAGVEVLESRAINALPAGGVFFLSNGADNFDCKALILTMGITQQNAFPGEAEFLGRGVSYCATCDGMLYRGKRVAVIGLNSEAPAEAEFLRSIGCEVEYFDKKKAKKYEIRGEDFVNALVADGEVYELDGVFILRSTIAPTSFLPGLDLENGHIKVDGEMKTSIEGVFAAGDCTGKPYQVARAVGQGNIAALTACEYLDKK